MQKLFLEHWRKLQPREQKILGGGVLLVGLMLFYAVIWLPWHRAIDHMETVLPFKRADLVWMRQQAALLKEGGPISKAAIKGENQSLLAVVEQTARASGVRDSIKQLVPRQNNQEVSVVLEAASFNRWVRWVDVLSTQYAVNIKQLSAERDSDVPDNAEIRVTFARN
ncbi:MAG: type II secretion system protein M [Gammaproteobacteria bacterium]|nr:type II secretion system protein M [Gammaproteobacteria bacterium]